MSNRPDIIKYDINLYHSYLLAFFVSAGVPNGEFPEILIAKCRSRFFGTWFFSLAEDFESWREGRKGPSKSGEKCSHWKVHMYEYTSPWAEFELTTSIVIGSVQVLIAQMVVNLITMRSCLRYPPLTWRCVQLILQVRTSIGTYQCLVVFSMYSIFIWHLNWLSWYICRKNYLKANKANIQ